MLEGEEMKDEALKLALEALEAWFPTWPNLIEKQKAAITAIKQALAAPVQEEDLYDLAVKADNGGQP